MRYEKIVKGFRSEAQRETLRQAVLLDNKFIRRLIDAMDREQHL